MVVTWKLLAEDAEDQKEDDGNDKHRDQSGHDGGCRCGLLALHLLGLRAIARL